MMSRIKVTNLGFINRDGNPDETQFDTWDETEIALCWYDFCCENGILVWQISKEVEEDD